MKSSQGLKPSKIAKWRAIVAVSTLPPVNEEWSPENEVELKRLRKKDIKMGDTAYGRLLLLAQKKKELMAVLVKSNKTERVEWKARIDLMDAVEASEDGEEEAA